MADDLHTRLRAAITRQLGRARRMERMAQEYQLEVQEPRLWGKTVPGWGEWPEVEQLALRLAWLTDRDSIDLTDHDGCHACDEGEHCDWMWRTAAAYGFTRTEVMELGDQVLKFEVEG